jgi:hypothetical protein
MGLIHAEFYLPDVCTIVETVKKLKAIEKNFGRLACYPCIASLVCASSSRRSPLFLHLK